MWTWLSRVFGSRGAAARAEAERRAADVEARLRALEATLATTHKAPAKTRPRKR